MRVGSAPEKLQEEASGLRRFANNLLIGFTDWIQVAPSDTNRQRWTGRRTLPVSPKSFETAVQPDGGRGDGRNGGIAGAAAAVVVVWNQCATEISL